jgi:hypothetical protein
MLLGPFDLLAAFAFAVLAKPLGRSPTPSNELDRKSVV